MKKIIFTLVALVASMSMNAQIMKIRKGSDVVETYTGSNYTVVFEDGPKWESMGYCTYTDRFLSILFGDDDQTYPVEIEQDVNNKGMYRLVYPYDSKCPYHANGTWDTSKTYYMEINAVNPDKVYIVPQEQGLDWGYGMFVMGSLAGYYVSKEYFVEAENYYGTLKDGVISFPAESLVVGMANYHEGALYAGGGGEMIVLPTESQKK